MNVITSAAARAGYSEEEWAVRCDLAALYRLVAHHRMTDLIYTHISARLPGSEHHFLINDYRRMFHEMRASDLVRIDMDGTIVEPQASGKVVNAAGFCIHSAIHMARPDLTTVVHTHTAAGIAVSAQKHGLLPISQHALKFYNAIGYHGYEGIALDLEERDRLVADLGEHKAMILRNHGLLVGGTSVQDAWLNIYYLERACQAQVAALSGGPDLIMMPEEEIRQHTAEQHNRQGREAHYAMMWETCLRLIENDKPDYRS